MIPRLHNCLALDLLALDLLALELLALHGLFDSRLSTGLVDSRLSTGLFGSRLSTDLFVSLCRCCVVGGVVDVSVVDGFAHGVGDDADGVC